MIELLCFALAVPASPFKSELQLEAENAVLRNQLIVLRRRLVARVRRTNNDRCFFKAPADLRSLARAHTELSVQTLAGIARNGTSDQARVAAAQKTARSWLGQCGSAARKCDGSGSFQVVIRQIIGVTGKAEPVLIEHEPDRRSR